MVSISVTIPLEAKMSLRLHAMRELEQWANAVDIWPRLRNTTPFDMDHAKAQVEIWRTTLEGLS